MSVQSMSAKVNFVYSGDFANNLKLERRRSSANDIAIVHQSRAEKVGQPPGFDPRSWYPSLDLGGSFFTNSGKCYIR